ncbi:baseplate assembly protein [Maritalea porphyrae]|uniref:baseplate assembly protein n=1 Tax=Maritalea porphyrae TaxID=880732 RepID=UPI0022AEF621|nr:baseplate assembly protein [Maritalea porphyrae]MCZ4273992.1 baseplate assembly protein [Maritalea porphyrae]
MSGIDGKTGRPINGWPEVQAALKCIVSTQITMRVRREQFGLVGLALLGRNMSPELFLRFAHLLAIAIDLWEPRFRPTSFFSRTGHDVSRGKLGFFIDGDYLPRGHLGDQTVAFQQTFLF